MNTAQIFSKFKRQPWLIGIALILIMVMIYFVTQKILGPKLLVHPVAVQNIVQTIVASGHVETPLRVDIASQITGTVASIPVAEGQTVKALLHRLRRD
jgi:HlyD family secretion protein